MAAGAAADGSEPDGGSAPTRCGRAGGCGRIVPKSLLNPFADQCRWPARPEQVRGRGRRGRGAGWTRNGGAGGGGVNGGVEVTDPAERVGGRSGVVG